MPDRPESFKKLQLAAKKHFKEQMCCDDPNERKSKFGIFQKKMAKALVKHKSDRDDRKRDMTEVVQTRWYRSPEVILTDKNYDQSADIWSLGVSLAELLYCATCRDCKLNQKDRYLFKGNSCFPMSPRTKELNKVD